METIPATGGGRATATNVCCESTLRDGTHRDLARSRSEGGSGEPLTKFLLPVLVLSALFRRRMLEALVAAHRAAKLEFFNDLAYLADAAAFADYLEPLKAKDWHVYAKRPFGGPKAVLAYLARYTHRVAISNSRLIKADADGVTFKVKDYRIDVSLR